MRLVQRAQIVQMAANGVLNQDIARELEISRPTVQLWRERFLALRLAGLEQDAPRPGRIPGIPESKVRAVVEATLHTKPPAATHWSVRTMARAQGISRSRHPLPRGEGDDKNHLAFQPFCVLTVRRALPG